MQPPSQTEQASKLAVQRANESANRQNNSSTILQASKPDAQTKDITTNKPSMCGWLGCQFAETRMCRISLLLRHNCCLVAQCGFIKCNALNLNNQPNLQSNEQAANNSANGNTNTPAILQLPPASQPGATTNDIADKLPSGCHRKCGNQCESACSVSSQNR